MIKKDFEVAKKLYEELCLHSDCCDEMGNLKRFDYVVAIGDDVTSAIYAVNMARQIKKIHGFYPTILCVGGQGILSCHLYNKSEAEVLADACLKLGYPKDLVCYHGLQTGRNSGENIKNVAKVTHAHYLHQPSVLFCVTKRQSLRYVLTQRKQEPYINAGWCVIDETFEEACKLMNARSLCGGEIMIHEIAAIWPRCQQYAGKFQEYPPAEVEPDLFLQGDAACLAKRFCLKLGGRPIYRRKDELFDGSFCCGIGKFRFTDYCRYVRLYISLLWNKKKIMKAIDDAIIMDNFDYGMTNANLAV